MTISNKKIISEENITEKTVLLDHITIFTMWKKKLIDNLKKLKEYYIEFKIFVNEALLNNSTNFKENQLIKTGIENLTHLEAVTGCKVFCNFSVSNV